MNPYAGDRQLDPPEPDHECPSCGYEFDELLADDEFRCPECGYKFAEPNDDLYDDGIGAYHE